eukprot:Skav228225  [mRNA]  locus=scaffold43:336940:337695:- [translate_table: standard]
MAEQVAKRAARAPPDLKIVVDDGELEVHSVILELASPVFASMLGSTFVEGLSGGSIQLPGKCKSELESFYKALQLCTMEVLTVASAVFLSKWADEYQVDALRTKCEDYLIASQPIDGPALQHAVKYRLSRRTHQCLNVMKGNIPQYVSDLHVLASRECEEHLKVFWPLILKAADLPLTEIPAAEHLTSMWPFVARAVKLQVKASRLERLEAEVITWPNALYGLMPATSKADERARAWMARTLIDHGFRVPQ